MADPKSKRRGRDPEEPEPLEAGLQGPTYDRVEDLDAEPDEYLLQKVVEANSQHHRTMRWGLGLGTLVLLAWATFLPQVVGNTLGVTLAVFLVAGALLGAGLHALQRQLELLRRAVAATDHFVFGPQDGHEGHDHPHQAHQGKG